MPLPEGFDDFEHLQDMLRIEHNKAVQAYFKNQPDNDISTPKRALKQACLIKDSDTATMTLMRQWLFEVNVGHMQSVQAPIYGIPVQELQRQSKFKPQIKLYFKEPYDFEKHKDGTEQVRGEIGFRIMNKTAETISRTDAVEYAREIKAEAEFSTNLKYDRFYSQEDYWTILLESSAPFLPYRVGSNRSDWCKGGHRGTRHPGIKGGRRCYWSTRNSGRKRG